MRTLDAMCHAHLRCHVPFLRSLTPVSMPTRPPVDVLVQHPTNNTPQHSKSTPAKAAVPHTIKQHSTAFKPHRNTPPNCARSCAHNHRPFHHKKLSENTQTNIPKPQRRHNSIDTVRTSNSFTKSSHPHWYAFLK